MHKVNSENSLAISGDNNTIIIQSGSELIQDTNSILSSSNTLSEKFIIELNENNTIIDRKELSEKIDSIIESLLDDNAIEIILTSLKFQKEYIASEFKEIKNQYKSYIKNNELKLKNIAEILNEFIPYAIRNRLFTISQIKLIFIGITDRIDFYSHSLSEYTKIDIYDHRLKFGTYIHLDKNELKSLSDRFESEMGISFCNFINSGYDIHDLPTDLKYTKAIPAILEEFFYKKYPIEDIKKYLSPEIGLG
ncbi:MAG: hypothetical protein Q7T91_11265 [Sulfuricurvum sp.]|nr:hypothetical protein [Sulfuricurvum sp.]